MDQKEKLPRDPTDKNSKKENASIEMRMKMINIHEVLETNEMIEKENLDVRTITLGISLLNCIDTDVDRLCEKIYTRITTVAKDLVATPAKRLRKNMVFRSSIREFRLHRSH